MQLQCASLSKPVSAYPLRGPPFLPIQKPGGCASISSSTLPTLKSRFRSRVSRIRRSILVHPCMLACSSSGCWTWMRSFFLLGRMIPICLLAFVLEADAYGSPGPLYMYPCEDVYNYYAGAEHEYEHGEALKRKLHSTISGHRSLSYKQVWDALMVLDASEANDAETSSGVVEIYSLRVVPKQLAGKPEGWNREHLWPRSYGLTGGLSLTDLHNIRPADVNVNSSRGNKYYGECCAGSTDCMKPANKEAATDTEADKERWTPPKQVRGDIARALMYMAVRYGFQEPGFPVLKLSDFPSTKNREMGLLSTLLKWNEIDPPSKEEKLRNERICNIYQHNRNPFVDHPEYAKLIWKQTTSLCRRLKLPSRDGS